jgi:pimeloyl-ACP methyl ester carboxylesterase
MRKLPLALAALGLLAAAAARAEAPSTPSSPAPRTGTVRNGEAVIAYRDWGSGPSIVIAPSLGRGCDDFNDLAPRLAAHGLRVLCPDPRGIGASTGPLENPTLHLFAGDLAAVITAEHLAPTVVLGHAYGNTVIRTLATDHPELVRGVILVTASGRAPLAPETVAAINQSSDLTLPEEQRRKALAAAYFAPGSDASVWLGGWYPKAQAAQWAASKATPPDVYIPAGGKAPILDIQGDHDVIIPPKYSQDLHHELGDRVQVVVIRDAGHAMVPEQPAAVTEAIVAWMRKLP